MRNQYQVAVPNRRQPVASTPNFNKTRLAIRFTSMAVEIIIEQYVKSSEKKGRRVDISAAQKRDICQLIPLNRPLCWIFILAICCYNY